MVTYLHGRDVASYQGAISQSTIQGDSFDFTKCSEGTFYINPYYHQQRSAIHAADAICGIYHLAHPEQTSANEESSYFLQNAMLRVGELVALDMEPQFFRNISALASRAWVDRWVEQVHKACGAWPVVYTTGWLVQNDYISSWTMQHCPLWYADPGADPANPPAVMGGWWPISFLQYSTSTGVDIDSGYFNSIDQLRKLTIPPTTPPHGGPMQDLGGDLISTPATIRFDDDGTTCVFGVGTDDNVWMNRWQAGTWSGWKELQFGGKPISAFSVAAFGWNAGGHKIHLYAVVPGRGSVIEYSSNDNGDSWS